MKKKWKGHRFLREKYVQILRVMKLYLLFTLFAVANVFATANSQTFNLAVKDASLKEIFQMIEKSSDYRFLYKSENR